MTDIPVTSVTDPVAPAPDEAAAPDDGAVAPAPPVVEPVVQVQSQGDGPANSEAIPEE